MSSVSSPLLVTDASEATPSYGELFCPYKNCTIPIDITLRTSEGINLGAHKKNLEVFSEGFPPVGWTVAQAEDDVEIVELPEKEIVLSLLLRFMHNAALPDLSIECCDWELDDLLSFVDAAEKYVVLNAYQAGEKALRSRADRMSEEELLMMVLRKALRSDFSDIDVFARRTVLISPRTVINLFKAHPVIYMNWSSYQIEVTKWRMEYVHEMGKERPHSKEGTCTLKTYLNIFNPLLHKIGGGFPSLQHFDQVEGLVDAIPTVSKTCKTGCKAYGMWRAASVSLLAKQKRWVDCIP